jgi:hypothetical protein
MSHGRTVWWPKDSAWWRRENVVTLGEEFGAAGPAVLDWLSCEAKSQNDGGFVKAGIRSCARGCFVDAVTVSHVLSRAVTLGSLDEYDEREGRFSCRISGWEADHRRGNAAFRKQTQREKTDASHTESRSVTKCHVKEEDKLTTTADAVVVSSPVDPEIDRLCLLHSELVRQRTETPSSSQQYRPTDSWRTEMRRLIERDGRKPAEIEAAIRWVHGHPFWGKNILSVPKLREQYGRLVVEAKSNGDRPKADDERLARNRRRLGLDRQEAS